MILNNPINLFAVAGLLIDIIGVLILFEYGLPSKVQSTTNILAIGGETEEETNAIEKENKRIHKWANIGLWMLIAGFILQLTGVFFTTPFYIRCK